MTIDESDRVVARALRRLPAPEHGPDFWDELEARLAGSNQAPRPEPPGLVVVEQGGATVVELHSSAGDGTARKVRRWARLGPLAAAAAIVAVFAGFLGTRDGGEDANRRVILAAPPATTDAPASSTATEPASGTGAVDTNDVAQRAAVTFLDALSTGDMRSAWDALGPASRDTWQSFDAFNAARSGFGEGLGTWASAANREVSTTTVQVDDKTGESLHVVTFTGERHPEGMPTTDPYAMVVRVEATGAAHVEPFTPHDTTGLRFVAPTKADTPAALSRSASVAVEVPKGYRSVGLVLDGSHGTTEFAGRTDGRDTVQLSFTPSGGWEKGTRVVTAFTVYADGTPAATAVLFEVA